ncbi:hypothetical protein F5Y00DRAFT_271106 [Daldinia vernicosa]|uniref:uncharacterized protein n=1 Tax=Daldinia vernicosa TaxID=114800 RepID=UPI002008DBCD|nr:uncharacterized protein F5Y00DRAFT_271106 [Daldinia vernicosa]KAI0847594.1 hypothetical protein F5Y00DRAFT_271106 [Daldinia vernicosa]
MATTPSSWLDDAFTSAKEDFKKSLKNPALYDFSKINSPDDVIDEAIRIQKQQAKTKTLRGLKRIDPLINGLKEYAAVIEVFVQVKPDIMGLIWGPLKFILQASSAVISAFDKVVKVIGDLGMTLPSFKIYAQLFESNHEIRRALCLFYADILDFYAVLINFLSNRRLNVFLESLWPNIRSSIAKIQENMEYHKAMMTANVTLEDIVQAHQARKLALEEHARAQAFRESQTFSAIRNELNPHNYDVELMDILRRSSVASGNWLDDEPDSRRWYDPADNTVRCLWLHGIPGSGKTFLVSNLIKKMQDSGERVIFVFLSHDDQASGDTVKVLHSLIFQLLEYDTTLRPIVYETPQPNHRKLKSDSSFVLDLLCTILNSLGASYIILDGLDELNENSWKHLLSSLLQINEKCPEAKLLISSREEREISLRLKSKSVPLRVDYKNLHDIDAFVQLECECIIDEKKRYGADDQTRMFIYAKLVLQMIKDQGTLYDIEMQMENLPDGLDQAYGRLLDRMKRGLTQALPCAPRPLREEEILQILVLEPGQSDFTKGRKEFRDICRACGPIIELHGGFIRFVHFSAKEYLLHEQSGSFLNLTESHLNAALLCATYLSFSSLNPLFHSLPVVRDDIQRRIMSGDYVVFEYMSAAFLEHLKTYLQSRDLDLDISLVTALRQLQEARGTAPVNGDHVPNRVVRTFKDLAVVPELQAFLSAAAYYQTQAKLGLTNQDGFSISDPLQIFLARRKLRQAIESMICQGPNHIFGCRCDHLKHLYGTKIYHCDQHFCYAYQSGFESKQARDRHFEIHERSHRCPMVNCLFSEIGFRDVTELQRHARAAHPPATLERNHADLGTLPIQPSDDLFEIFRSAVVLDQRQVIEEMLIRMQETSFEKGRWDQLICEASSKASSYTLSCILVQPWLDVSNYSPALSAALSAESFPNIKLLLSFGLNMSDQIDYERVIYSVTGKVTVPVRPTGYIFALSRWSPNLVAFLVNECQVEFPEQVDSPELIFIGPPTDVYTPDEAMKRFNEIKQYIVWPGVYELGVVQAMVGGCVVGVRICLENGADPNAIHRMLGDNSKANSLLYHAIYIGGERGAELVKLLLKHGVSVEGLNFHSKKMDKKMAIIERCFGYEWEEVVRRIRAGEDLTITPRRKKQRA